MWNTATDERLTPEERRKLLVKSLPSKIGKWVRDVDSCSIGKIRKLRRLMKELDVDETTTVVRGMDVASHIKQLRELMTIQEVMTS